MSIEVFAREVISVRSGNYRCNQILLVEDQLNDLKVVSHLSNSKLYFEVIKDVDLIVLKDDSLCICARHSISDVLSFLKFFVYSLLVFLFDGY